MRRRVFLHGVGVAGATLGLARQGVAARKRKPPATMAAGGAAPAPATVPPVATSAGGPWSPNALAGQGVTLGLRLTRFESSHAVAVADAAFPATVPAGSSNLSLDGMTMTCQVRFVRARDRRDAGDIEVAFRVLRGRLTNASVAVTLTMQGWSRDAYVLIPGAVYGGNRFASRRLPYPPLITEPSDIGPHVPPIVSDIPRLNNQSGESRLTLSSVEAAVPTVGVRLTGTGGHPAGDRGFLLLGEPTTALGLTSLAITETADRTAATLSIGTPGVRPDVRYALCNGRSVSLDRGAEFDAGSAVTLRLRLLSFPCPDVQTLFDRWYEARRDRVGPPKLRHDLPLSAARGVIEERLVVDQWADLPGFFRTRAPTIAPDSAAAASPPLRESTFQTGADSALALAVPMLVAGQADARRRAAAVLDFQLGGQAPSGLFHAASNGVDWWDEGEEPPAPGADRGPGAAPMVKVAHRVSEGRPAWGRHWTHIGRNCEALHLACRQVLFLLKVDPTFQMPDPWRAGLTRTADAVVRLWGRHQQLGQYVNSETGDVVVGGSAAAALAPAALVLASRVLENESYARCALEVAESFHARFVRAGLMLGGAPAALQAPDSRSAAGMMASFIALAETTEDEVWFTRAAEVAHQLATWVVAWDVPLPKRSTLGRLGARTTGAVIVSAQDKWALPGFVGGGSGDALLRLYRATGRTSYLELLRETIHNSSGYVHPEDRRPELDTKAGWVAGRIPMNDIIGSPGDVPAGTPCGAAQASCLTAATDVPSLYVQPDTGFLFAFDHIAVRIKQRTAAHTVVSVSNPTRFEAELRVFSELDAERSKPLDPFFLWGARSLTLAAGATEDIEFSRSPE